MFERLREFLNFPKCEYCRCLPKARSPGAHSHGTGFAAKPRRLRAATLQSLHQRHIRLFQPSRKLICQLLRRAHAHVPLRHARC